jgi:hypothetical protein
MLHLELAAGLCCLTDAELLSQQLEIGVVEQPHEASLYSCPMPASIDFSLGCSASWSEVGIFTCTGRFPISGNPDSNSSDYLHYAQNASVYRHKHARIVLASTLHRGRTPREPCACAPACAPQRLHLGPRGPQGPSRYGSPRQHAHDTTAREGSAATGPEEESSSKRGD